MKVRIHSIPSPLGGSNYYDDTGKLVGYSVPGVLGGENIYGTNGERGFTVDSPICGQNYYGDKGFAYSVPSLINGENIHGDIEGFSVDSMFGGETLFLDD